MLRPTFKYSWIRLKEIILNKPISLFQCNIRKFDWEIDFIKQKKYLLHLKRFDGTINKRLFKLIGITDDCYINKKSAKLWIDHIKETIGYGIAIDAEFSAELELQVEDGFKIASLIYRLLLKEIKNAQ